MTLLINGCPRCGGTLTKNSDPYHSANEPDASCIACGYDEYRQANWQHQRRRPVAGKIKL